MSKETDLYSRTTSLKIKVYLVIWCRKGTETTQLVMDILQG